MYIFNIICDPFISHPLIRECVGVDFQEELSDMLLLKMLQSATRASADKDRVSAPSLSLTHSLTHSRTQTERHRLSYLLRLATFSSANYI